MANFRPGDKVWLKVGCRAFYKPRRPKPLTVLRQLQDPDDGMAICVDAYGEASHEWVDCLFFTKEEAAREKVEELRRELAAIESTPIPEGWL